MIGLDFFEEISYVGAFRTVIFRAVICFYDKFLFFGICSDERILDFEERSDDMELAPENFLFDHEGRDFPAEEDIEEQSFIYIVFIMSKQDSFGIDFLRIFE